MIDVYMKSIAIFLSVLWYVLIAACSDSTQENPQDKNESLANTVFAGEDRDGKWATFAFIDEDRVYYFHDNAAHYDWEYTYTHASRIGSIQREGTLPGTFTVSDDNLTIRFSNYLGTQGDCSFKRVRDQNAEDEEVPFTIGALPADLDNTVWAGTA